MTIISGMVLYTTIICLTLISIESARLQIHNEPVPDLMIFIRNANTHP